MSDQTPKCPNQCTSQHNFKPVLRSTLNMIVTAIIVHSRAALKGLRDEVTDTSLAYHVT